MKEKMLMEGMERLDDSLVNWYLDRRCSLRVRAALERRERRPHPALLVACAVCALGLMFSLVIIATESVNAPEVDPVKDAVEILMSEAVYVPYVDLYTGNYDREARLIIVYGDGYSLDVAAVKTLLTGRACAGGSISWLEDCDENWNPLRRVEFNEFSIIVARLQVGDFVSCLSSEFHITEDVDPASVQRILDNGKNLAFVESEVRSYVTGVLRDDPGLCSVILRERETVDETHDGTSAEPTAGTDPDGP